MEFCPNCGSRLEPKKTVTATPLCYAAQNATLPSSQLTEKLKHEQAQLFNQKLNHS